MMRAKNKFQPLTLENVSLLYSLLFDSNIISFPLSRTSLEKVEALLSNVNNSYFGYDSYSSKEEKAVAYLYFIIKDHPFVDGNKRIAVLSFGFFCKLNSLEPQYKGFTLDELAVYIESLKEKDHDTTIKRLVKLIFI